MNSSSSESITIDGLLRVLAEQRRRAILRQLAATELPIDLDQLVTRLDPSRRAGADSSRATLTTELHHAHLPKLQDAGVIVYDHTAKTIRPGPTFADAVALLETIQKHREDAPT